MRTNQEHKFTVHNPANDFVVGGGRPLPDKAAMPRLFLM
jgi:hypothetical protein